MESENVKDPMSILGCLDQHMDKSANVCKDFKSTIDYVVDNSNNILLRFEKNKLPEGDENVEPYTVSTEVKQSIVNIVQNYGKFVRILEHNNARAPSECREELSKLIQSFKTLVWKLTAIRDKVEELTVAGSVGNFNLWPEESGDATEED